MRKVHDLRASRFRNLFRDFPIVVRFHQDRFDFLRLYLRDDLREMRWRRWNPRLRFEENVDIETESVGEIRPRIVVGDEALALVGQQFCTPFLELGVDRFLEFFFVRLISCGMARIDRRKGVRDMLRDGFRNNRVDHEVRITHRVDIAGRASERRWDFQKPDPLRRFHPSRLSDFDFWIARILQEWREPTDLEFRSAIELSCLLRDNMRLGVALAHLSNAGLADHNPGIETLSFTFGWLDPFVPRRP